MSGKGGIAIRMVPAIDDMDTHMRAADIFVAEISDFLNAQAGKIEKCSHGFLLEINHGWNQGQSLLSGKGIGKIFIKFIHRNLNEIP